MKAAEVELAVAEMFGWRQNLIVPNISWGMGLFYEADMIVVTRSGYVSEIEIKVSKADFIRDFNKLRQHDGKFIKRVYFAVPEGLYNTGICNSLPKEYGVIKVTRAAWSGVKAWREHPATNRKEVGPLDDEQRRKLLELCYMRVWSMKGKMLKQGAEK